MQQPKPDEQHRWLHQLVGQWTYQHENWSGTETVRTIGDLWVVAEGSGQGPDGPATTLMTLGYDPQRQRFTGTFIASMMTHLWIYDGALDDARKVLTLDTEGPAMSGEGVAKYRDAIEFTGDGERLLTSHILGEDGNWRQIMAATYRRTG
jgi:hypothetical protein